MQVVTAKEAVGPLTENLSQVLLVFHLTHCGHGKIHVLSLSKIKQTLPIVTTGSLHTVRHTVWINSKHRSVTAVIIENSMTFITGINEEAV